MRLSFFYDRFIEIRNCIHHALFNSIAYSFSLSSVIVFRRNVFILLSIEIDFSNSADVFGIVAMICKNLCDSENTCFKLFSKIHFNKCTAL